MVLRIARKELVDLWRDGRFRLKPATFVVFATARSAASSSSLAEVASSSKVSSIWSMSSPVPALTSAGPASPMVDSPRTMTT